MQTQEHSSESVPPLSLCPGFICMCLLNAPWLFLQGRLFYLLAYLCVCMYSVCECMSRACNMFVNVDWWAYSVLPAWWPWMALCIRACAHSPLCSDVHNCVAPLHGILFVLFYFETGSLSSSRCSETHYIDQTGLKIIEIPPPLPHQYWD